jgi:DNA-binding IclR family transcriptional regulator
VKVTSQDDRYTVRSVVRALDVLTVLSTQNRPVSLADLAKETGLNPSTAFRLLESMRVRGFRSVAAVSVSGPAFRIREQGIENVARRVTERAAEVSIRMGGRKP